MSKRIKELKKHLAGVINNEFHCRASVRAEDLVEVLFEELGIKEFQKLQFVADEIYEAPRSEPALSDHLKHRFNDEVGRLIPVKSNWSRTEYSWSKRCRQFTSSAIIITKVPGE